MDKELITVASVLIGGLIGFLSSYLTQRLNYQNIQRQAAIPRKIESIEFISHTIFRLMSGEKLTDKEKDKYIKSCYWMGAKQSIFIALLQKSEDADYLKYVQEEILNEFHKLTNGE
ncbi:MAG: hypothetical protein JAZ17_01865 [Candidatus Thiodiazotropha endolucinida]|nr:hypothetical protein [Candidatus Thiodiazotropha endolucinida]